jgi:hypothetical protein
MARQPNSPVPRGRDAGISLVDIFNGAAIRPAEFVSAISRAIVHHNDLARRDILPKDALNRSLQEAFAIERGNDYGKPQSGILT